MGPRLLVGRARARDGRDVRAGRPSCRRPAGAPPPAGASIVAGLDTVNEIVVPGRSDPILLAGPRRHRGRRAVTPARALAESQRGLRAASPTSQRRRRRARRDSVVCAHDGRRRRVSYSRRRNARVAPDRDWRGRTPTPVGPIARPRERRRTAAPGPDRRRCPRTTSTRRRAAASRWSTRTAARR